MTTMRGFTLIEMLVVLAIIAILALVALPNTSDRVTRAQITEALPLADIAKAPLALAWKTTQTFPADNAAAGLPVPEKIVNNYISSLTVENGAIHIVFGNRANGLIKDKTLTLRPAVVEGEPVVPVVWVCGSAANYLPIVCRSI
jgi:type IV pilus assembly protein PilA